MKCSFHYQHHKGMENVGAIAAQCESMKLFDEVIENGIRLRLRLCQKMATTIHNEEQRVDQSTDEIEVI